MIKIEDIRDHDSLKQWLTQWPGENGLDKDAGHAIAVTAAAFWNSTRTDCRLIANGENVLLAPLWAESDKPFWSEDDESLMWSRDERQLMRTAENPFRETWEKVKTLSTAPEYAFWIKWYEDALTGRAPNRKMLEQIALIDPEVWDAGAEAVAEEIARIVASFPNPTATENCAPAIQKTVARNLATIPPQIDALTATIDAAIERLRGKNPQDDVEKAGIDRLRQTFEAMRGALSSLSEKLPDEGEPPIEDAEEMEGLLGLYRNQFQKWPRENAADLVDSSCRVVLIGLTAGVLTAFGVPAFAATAVAGIAYGGKKLVGIGKVVKDAAKSGD